MRGDCLEIDGEKGEGLTQSRPWPAGLSRNLSASCAAAAVAGLPDDQLNTAPLTGRGHPLLAVFDPVTLKITATFKAN
jgi:hypothetical protein